MTSGLRKTNFVVEYILGGSEGGDGGRAHSERKQQTEHLTQGGGRYHFLGRFCMLIWAPPIIHP